MAKSLSCLTGVSQVHFHQRWWKEEEGHMPSHILHASAISRMGGFSPSKFLLIHET